MVNHRDANRKVAWRAAVLTLIAVAVSLICLDAFLVALLGAFSGLPAAHAQSIMRTPSLNIAPRVPAITSGAGARVNANIPSSVGRDGPHISVRVNTVVHSAPRIAVVVPK